MRCRARTNACGRESRGALFVSEELAIDRVRDPSLQTAHGFHRFLVGGSPASVVGATFTVEPELSWARELPGGNGILLKHHVGRFVADADADAEEIYSYEGTPTS